MIPNIDLNKIVKWLTPHFLWKPKQIAWLTVLLSPLLWLYDQFLVYRLDKLKEATTNSQVIRLTRALRDNFSNEEIVILHFSDYINQAFEYLEIEGSFNEFDYLSSDGHLPDEFDFFDNEYDAQTDFVVRIPGIIENKKDAIAAFVNKYVLAGKRFKIEIV